MLKGLLLTALLTLWGLAVFELLLAEPVEEEPAEYAFDVPASALFAAIYSAFLPWFWTTTRRWQRSESGPTNWPPTAARAILVKGGLVVCFAVLWTDAILTLV